MGINFDGTAKNHHLPLMVSHQTGKRFGHIPDISAILVFLKKIRKPHDKIKYCTAGTGNTPEYREYRQDL
jgi:hypothetical protein